MRNNASQTTWRGATFFAGRELDVFSLRGVRPVPAWTSETEIHSAALSRDATHVRTHCYPCVHSRAIQVEQCNIQNVPQLSYNIIISCVI